VLEKTVNGGISVFEGTWAGQVGQQGHSTSQNQYTSCLLGSVEISSLVRVQYCCEYRASTFRQSGSTWRVPVLARERQGTLRATVVPFLSHAKRLEDGNCSNVTTEHAKSEQFRNIESDILADMRLKHLT
jgi:hypothetical protein